MFKVGVIMILKFLGDPVETNQDPLDVDDTLPDFVVTDANHKNVTFADLKGKFALILTIPDINSKVCSLETKKFNRKADKYSAIKFFTISKNTVEEQKEWCAAKGVTNMQMLSDPTFSLGKPLGAYVPKIDAFARMAFVIDATGRIIYRQVVPEIGSQPDFKAIDAVLKNISE
jgi:thioredoxin-dependent peroxiredoxin